MTNPVTYAVLLADISGSVSLYEELGDERALGRVELCLRVLEQAARESAGRIVKTTGDGLMCAFGSGDAALRAAHCMQTRIAQQAELGGPALGIHIGCHYGPVLESAGDLYGDCVNVAARIAALAKAGQVIATQEVVARIGPDLRGLVRAVDRVSVKGKRELLEIYELLWQETDQLTLLGTRYEECTPGLRLVAGGRELWFDGTGATAVALGRDAACQIVVEDRKTSRRHARIEKRRDKYVLVDHSSNGTYVVIGTEDEICLRHEELILREHGCIGLGHRTREADATLLQFYVCAV